MAYIQRWGRSWRELLMLLRPAELATTGLLIFNKLVGTYKDLLRLWWVTIPLLACALFLPSTIVWFFLFVVLLVRPSVTQKSAAARFAQPKILLIIVLGITGMLMSGHVPAWVMLLLLPFVSLLVLCMLDAYLTLRAQKDALLRALTLCLYHYPFFFCMTALVLVPCSLLHFSGSIFITMLIGAPFYSAAMVYGYIRFMREHMDYYYE